jgi:hypothetical protein
VIEREKTEIGVLLAMKAKRLTRPRYRADATFTKAPRMVAEEEQGDLYRAGIEAK